MSREQRPTSVVHAPDRMKRSMKTPCPAGKAQFDPSWKEFPPSFPDFPGAENNGGEIYPPCETSTLGDGGRISPLSDVFSQGTS